MVTPSSGTIIYAALASFIFQTVSASFEKIDSYTPLTDVSDRAAIANDQRVIGELMKNPTSSSFEVAKNVYEEGGSSRPIATISVPGGVPKFMQAQNLITGTGVDGRVLTVALLEDVEAGATEVKVRYLGNGSFERPHDCIVGSLPNNEIIMEGCLSGNGTVVLDTAYGEDPVEFSYNYDIEANTKSMRTLQGFSLDADTLFRVGAIPSNPYIDSFQPFVDYYGRADYADHIIQASIMGIDTEMKNGNLNMGSADYAGTGLAQVFKKATAFVVMTMAILYELESAVYQCDSSCNVGDCNEDPHIFSLDEAVAYFRGQHAVFAYALNQKRCPNFGTCFDSAITGEATANIKAYQLFDEMQAYLVKAQCDNARATIPKIATQLWIGLIQGTLRYAWQTDTAGHNIASSPSEVKQAEGAIFAAGVLPMIEKCNPVSAKTIYDNLAVSAQINVDYVAVKEAFESCYGYLGITCGDIGGLVGGGMYDACAALPCGGESTLRLDFPPSCVVEDVGNDSGATSTARKGLFWIFGSLFVAVPCLLWG